MDHSNMKGKRVYIAGPMTGKPHWNFPAFKRAAAYLRALGAIVVCPAEIDYAVWGFNGEEELRPGMSHRTVMPIDLQLVLTCQCIYLMAGWSNSSGAVVEAAFSQCLKQERYYEAGAERGVVGFISGDCSV